MFSVPANNIKSTNGKLNTLLRLSRSLSSSSLFKSSISFLGGSLFLPEIHLESTNIFLYISSAVVFFLKNHYLQQFHVRNSTPFRSLEKTHRATFYVTLLSLFEMRKFLHLNNWKLSGVLSVKKELGFMPAAILNLQCI